jgi:hypothetical protein
MKTTTTYTVSQIKDGIVYLDITGNVSGAALVDLLKEVQKLKLVLDLLKKHQ